MRVHEAIPYGGPVVVPIIDIRSARLFLVVASANLRIEGCNLLLHFRPLPSTIPILGWPRLETALVSIGPRIPDILIATCLRKKQSKADAARRFGIGRIEPLGARNDNPQIDDVFEWRR